MKSDEVLLKIYAVLYHSVMAVENMLVEFSEEN